MTIQLKRNDTKDTIQYNLTYADGTPVSLSGATVRFLMGSGKKVVANASASIVDAPKGEVEYTLTESDTLLSGTFKAEFEVTFSDGKVKTFPHNGYIMVNIQPNIDKDQSTYIEDQIAYRVSDLQILKNEIQAQIDQAIINGDSSVEAAQARVESDGTVNTTLKARLDKKEAEFSTGIETLTSELAQTPSIRMFNVFGDGTDETVAFQNALNNSVNKTLHIPKQTGDYYLLGKITIPSNIVLDIDPGTVFMAVDTLEQEVNVSEPLFDLTNAENVIIYGNNATAKMNKSVYLKEWNHIFAMNGSKNITIYDFNAIDSGGDGFYLGNKQSTQSYCENIKLYNCRATNNRRQGLSITSVDGFYAENCTFEKTDGTAPMAGVDIEPNYSTDRIKNVVFKKCKSIENVKDGFEINLSKLNADSEYVSILFEDCVSRGDNYGFIVRFIRSGSKGLIEFRNCLAEVTEYSGFAHEQCSSDGIDVKFIKCRTINCNTIGSTSNVISHGSHFYVKSVNETAEEIGNVEFVDCKAFDTNTTSKMSRGFSINPTSNGSTPKNIKFINCDAQGYSDSRFFTHNTSIDCEIKNDPPFEFVIPSGSGSVDLLKYRGHIFKNEGAGALRQRTLPTPKLNDKVSFRVDVNYEVRIYPPADKQILTLTSGVGKAISCSTVGASITLRGKADGNWEIVNIVGTWTEVTA